MNLALILAQISGHRSLFTWYAANVHGFLEDYNEVHAGE